IFAKNLRRKKTNTLGVIVPKLNSNFMSSVIAGIEKVANENGYNLIISQSFETAEKEASNVETMFQNRVDRKSTRLNSSHVSVSSVLMPYTTLFQSYFCKQLAAQKNQHLVSYCTQT